jgi:tRNA(Phe) wybutosine-synthesizing methylase Tyw3
MSIRNLLDTIKKGVEFAEGFTPLLSLIPGLNVAAVVATATSAIGAVTEVVENVVTVAQEGKLVLESHDQAELEGYLARIQKANDELMKYVDGS